MRRFARAHYRLWAANKAKHAAEADRADRSEWSAEHSQEWWARARRLHPDPLLSAVFARSKMEVAVVGVARAAPPARQIASLEPRWSS